MGLDIVLAMFRRDGMAELYLVRHGQASFGAESDDELSPSGRTQ